MSILKKSKRLPFLLLTLVALIALGAFWEKQDINTTTKEQTLSLFVNHAVKHTDERKKLLFGIRQTTAVTTNIFIAKGWLQPIKILSPQPSLPQIEEIIEPSSPLTLPVKVIPLPSLSLAKVKDPLPSPPFAKTEEKITHPSSLSLPPPNPKEGLI